MPFSELEARQKIYASVRERTQLSWDEFQRAAREFRVVPVTAEGHVIGGIMIRGNELHIGCTERPRGAAMRKYLGILRETINEFGCALTSVAPGCTAISQLRRLGFEQIGEFDGSAIMLCKRSAYA